MLTCKEAAELVSSEDFETLPWLKRTALRLHMFMCSCPNCTAFGEQITLLRNLGRAFEKRQESELNKSNLCLPPEAKERIIQSLEK